MCGRMRAPTRRKAPRVTLPTATSPSRSRTSAKATTSSPPIPRPGNRLPRKVIDAFSRVVDKLRILEVRTDSGRIETIRTTDEHPFWVDDTEDFLPAGDLEPGDSFHGPTGEKTTLVSTRSEDHPEGVVVYNFEVEGSHTYFVLAAGEDGLTGAGVLVHNAKGRRCGGGGGGRSGKPAKWRSLLEDPNTPKSIKGWIRQELNRIRAKRTTYIRNPPGKRLAHERGRESAKGFSYRHSNLQDKANHDLQHRHDDFGRKNNIRPLTPSEEAKLK